MNEVRDIIIGAVIMVIIATAGISMMSMVNSDNSLFLENNSRLSVINQSFNDVSTGLDDVTTDTNSTLAIDTETRGLFGFIDDLVRSVTSTFKTIGRSMSFLNTFSRNLDAWLPIPTWLGGFLVTLLTLIIGFAIIKAILKVS